MSAYRLTADAQRDLRDIRDYIARGDSSAANRMLDRIRDKLMLTTGQMRAA